MVGRIHSCESMGTVDGPGIRFVVFLQGCALRCIYCHNPDTWDFAGGETISAPALMEKIKRCRPYFAAEGGVTVSGGEALLQQEFVTELFTLCRAEGIHTALDTSGCLLDERTAALLAVTDLCLLDVKWSEETAYRQNSGCSLGQVLAFLSLLAQKRVPVWVRQVSIPGLTGSKAQVDRLVSLVSPYPNVEKIELLAFHKLCEVKYHDLGLAFPLAHVPEMDREALAKLQQYAGQRLAQSRRQIEMSAHGPGEKGK